MLEDMNSDVMGTKMRTAVASTVLALGLAGGAYSAQKVRSYIKVNENRQWGQEQIETSQKQNEKEIAKILRVAAPDQLAKREVLEKSLARLEKEGNKTLDPILFWNLVLAVSVAASVEMGIKLARKGTHRQEGSQTKGHHQPA